MSPVCPWFTPKTHGEGHIRLIACVVPNILVEANHQMKSLLLIAMQYSKEGMRINTERVMAYEQFPL